MPTQKPLSRYPEEYRKLFLRAAMEGVVIVPCASHEAAVLLRKDLYNFRQAVREDTPRPPTREDHELIVAANALKFQLRRDKLIIRLYETVYAAIIRKALEKEAAES